MTVINHYFVGRKASTETATEVRARHTIGDYLPATVGALCGIVAGAVTLAAMLSPITY